MEQGPPLFSLLIDPEAKVHLTEAAKWARFLSIIGMIVLGILVLILVVGVSFIPDSPLNDVSGFSSVGLRAGLAAYGIILGLLWFFPCLFLYRFSSKLRVALSESDQHFLNTAFQNLKILFRYLGIITIIVLSMYVLIFLIFLISLGTFR